jgi:hypothetical protein
MRCGISRTASPPSCIRFVQDYGKVAAQAFIERVLASVEPPANQPIVALCLSNLARSIAERDAQPDSWHLDGTGAFWSDEVKRVVMRLRPAEAARARIETHTPER